MNMIEGYIREDRKVIFYIAHSDTELSTGILIMGPKTELSKHSRPVPEKLRHFGRGRRNIRNFSKSIPCSF